MGKKVLLGLLGLFFVVVLGLFLWVRSAVANDRVRTALAAQISRGLGQPVTIGGVGATVFPRVSITLTDVAIGTSTPIQIRSLRVGTDLRALLSRRIEHASVHLNGGQVRLPLPVLNIPSSTPSSSSDRQPGSAPVELVSIDEIVMSGLEIVSGGRTLRGEIEVIPQGRGALVRKASLTAEGVTLTATGRIADLEGPIGDLSITAGSVDFDQLVAFANDFSHAAGITTDHLSSNTEPAPARPSGMDLTVALQSDRATIGGLSIDHVTARARAKGDTVTVDPLAFNLFDGHYEGSLAVILGDTPEFRWKAALANIDVASAAGFAGSPNTVSGRLAATIDLMGKGADASEAMRTVHGAARLDVTNGIVRNLGLVRSVGAATALSFEGLRRAAAGASDTDEPFSRLGATLVIADGAASTSDLKFEAADLSLSAEGSVQLDASAIRLRGRLQLSELLSQQVHQKMLRISQEQGRVVLPATITGPVSAPVVRIDAAGMAKRALRNTVSERAPDLIRKGLGGLIRK